MRAACGRVRRMLLTGFTPRNVGRISMSLINRAAGRAWQYRAEALLTVTGVHNDRQDTCSGMMMDGCVPSCLTR